MICPYCHQDAGGGYLCPHCNTMLRSPTSVDLDRGGFWPILIGLLLPSIGVILGLVWRQNKPKSSRHILISSIVSLLVYAIGTMILMYAYYAIYLPNLLDSLMLV